MRCKARAYIYIERERERMGFWDMAILVVALFIGG
jgi:hypothetical protein